MPREVRGARRRSPTWFTVLALTLTLWSVAAAAIPDFGSGGLRTAARTRSVNESVAIATLKNLSSAQSQLQASGAVDVDGNGQGEYGYFAELAGAVPLRGESHPCDPVLLSKRFGNVQEGRVQTSGYWFQIFLPGEHGDWIAESANGGGGVGVLASRAESEWLCYAWPVHLGLTGNQAFLMTSQGDVTASNMGGDRYDADSPPHPGRSGFRKVAGKFVLAINELDEVGNMWFVRQ